MDKLTSCTCLPSAYLLKGQGDEDALCQVTERDPAQELVLVLETLSQLVRGTVLSCR